MAPLPPPPPSTISYAPLHRGPVLPPRTKGKRPFLNNLLPATPNAVNVSTLVAYVVFALALAYGAYVDAQDDAWGVCLIFYAMLVISVMFINAVDAELRDEQMLPT